jgi:hypothetical protein
MLKFTRWLLMLLVAVLSTVAITKTFSAQAQDQNTPKVPITTTVTVLGPKFTAPPPLTRQDITAFSNKTRLDVINWVPAQGERAPLQLAIVIDNSANQLGVGTQLNDLAAFIRRQSRSTAVGVFYAANGTVQTASNFSTNHEAVAKTLRLPLGPGAGDSPSVYLSLSDLIKNRWPVTGARREVLLISSGVDRLDRGPQSPYVAAAIEDSQKAGVVVHAIYTDGVRFGETLHGQFAQDNLVQLTDQSGGFNFFEGISTPVSFAPYLNQLDMVLHNQYLLTVSFPRSGKEKGELRPIEMRTEQHNVTLKYPKQVLVSGHLK